MVSKVLAVEVKNYKEFIGEVRVYVDACCRPNPGRAACGILVLDSGGKVLDKRREYLGDSLTNNSAEYRAVRQGLEVARHYTSLRVIVHSDSELVIKQLNRKYRVRDDALFALHKEIRSLEAVYVEVCYLHLPRENEFLKQAHCEAEQALVEHLTGCY